MKSCHYQQSLSLPGNTILETEYQWIAARKQLIRLFNIWKEIQMSFEKRPAKGEKANVERFRIRSKA